MYGEWCLDDYIVNDLVCRGCIDILMINHFSGDQSYRI